MPLNIYQLCMFINIIISELLPIFQSIVGASQVTGGKGPAGQCRRCKRREFSPWIWRIPQRRKRHPTIVFLVENPMDRGTWWATVHGVAKSRTQLKQLSMHTLCSHMEIYGCTVCKVLSYKSIHHILTVRPWVGKLNLQFCVPLSVFIQSRSSMDLQQIGKYNLESHSI